MKRTLFLVSRSPFERGEFASTLRLVRPGDGIAFIQCGVTAIGALPPQLWQEITSLKDRGVAIYALKEDLQARGLRWNRLGAELADYDRLLDLFAEYSLVVGS